MTRDPATLVVNCGSSRVKFALFADERGAPRRLATGALERVGLSDGRFSARAADGSVFFDEALDIPNHVAALDMLLSKIADLVPRDRLWAVGHRVVHGGSDCDCPLIVTPALEARLRKLIPLAPLHLPHNLAGILAVRVRRPDLPQVAAFDTAFHHGLPRATMSNIRQNLFFALVYNAAGVPVVAGVLYPFLGILISPIFAAAAMSLSSVSVIGNALRLRSVRI